MSKWRELKYYAWGTPTKAKYADRRRHLFTYRFGRHNSSCGLQVITVRLSEGPTTVQKCGHCVKASGG